MTNGHNQDEPGRLDRIEAMMEGFETDLSQLLKAQIVFGDEVSKAFKAAEARMTRFETELAEATAAADARMTRFETGLAEMADKLANHMEAADARMNRVETGLAEATDKLNALIDLMDRHLREHGEGKA
jgi:archaellum component FlaC